MSYPNASATPGTALTTRPSPATRAPTLITIVDFRGLGSVDLQICSCEVQKATAIGLPGT
jgi:hypothetical protein